MQGFNMGRYVPPELEGTTSFNKASGKGHPLGSRARKLKSEGVLTVRFELPFPVWCTNCQPEQIVGQGVRFNAEKKKVGNYYSTPIWSFRFKHTVCGGWIEVKTDPKNAEYVVVSGGRRRDLGDDKILDGEIKIGLTEEEKERLERDGGFGLLEKKVQDKKKMLSEAGRIEELKKISEKVWADPYERNRQLRRGFRVGRKIRDEERRTGEAIQDKYGLDVEIVAGRQEDDVRASLVEFGTADEESQTDFRPMFQGDRENRTSSTPPIDRGKRGRDWLSSGDAVDQKQRLQQRLSGNTRAARDPFLEDRGMWVARGKRKKVDNGTATEDQKILQHQALVGYESDSA